MDIFAVLSLVGGLALFLFGMDTMGDGLVKISGGKLEAILERLTSKRFMALLTGAFVTAVIQSSSATTVMVVGFVNSGIMELEQVVGIIMGANVGTTITSWILSLTGIEGDNVFIKLLKPSSFSPVLAAIGIILSFAGKEGSKKKDVGSILLGFAVLMFGMETMSDSVAPLADNEKFTSMLLKFSNPILGMLAGAILTAVIQSSSASVGILQALCATGAVTYSTAIPIIMGQNIGTCVTALISALGANRNAKRAAMIHLFFNLIGTVFFMVVFYSANRIADFAFMHLFANAAGIAVIHSCFNVGCALLLFPFADKLVQLAKHVIHDGQDEERASDLPSRLLALDDRFVDNPSYAIGLCREAVNEMAVIAKDTFVLADDTLQNYSKENAEAVKKKEDLLDLYDDYTGAYLIRISARGMSNNDNRNMSLLLHCITDFERISDHSKNVAETAEAMKSREMNFSQNAKSDIAKYSAALNDIIGLTVEAFLESNTEKARMVEPLEEVIDSMCKDMKSRHIARLQEGNCTHETSMYFEDMVTDYERISDHCSNIAISLIESDVDKFEPHHYLKNTMKNDTEWFQSKVFEYAEKYSLQK